MRSNIRNMCTFTCFPISCTSRSVQSPADATKWGSGLEIVEVTSGARNKPTLPLLGLFNYL